jgi:hypothetical protein
MAAERGQKQTKTLIEDLITEAKSRGHTVLEYKVGRNIDTIPKHTYCKFQCNKCNSIWQTKLFVYLQRIGQAKGCRTCFNILIKDKTVYEKTPFAPNDDLSGRPFRRQGKNRLIENHANGPHKHIKNREDLVNYLELNPNKHNDYVFNLMRREPPLFNKGEFSRHHIIPIHNGGSPEKWNILVVSKKEHEIIHTLRYEVYQQTGDQKAIHATKNDAEMLKANQGHIKEQEETFKPIGSRYLYKRTTETLRAIENGMIWKHEDGYELIIQPNQVQTINEIKNLLIDLLPENHTSRKKITKNSTSNNYIRQVINNVFSEDSSLISNPKNRVYRFSLKPLN